MRVRWRWRWQPWLGSPQGIYMGMRMQTLAADTQLLATKVCVACLQVVGNGASGGARHVRLTGLIKCVTIVHESRLRLSALQQSHAHCVTCNI
eukprot:14100323-Alexandrium_andersonii.AAC.1